MAKKTAAGSLKSKLGSRGQKSFDAVKGNETRYSSAGELPPGIEGGIAELVECKFDTYSKGDQQGEYYFRAAGIVRSPKSIIVDGNTVVVEGLQTSIQESVCETPGRSRLSIEEHLDWVMNEMRKLGIETNVDDLDDLEEAAAMLKEAGPAFRFRTWRGDASEQYPNPRTNHQWGGVKGLEDWVAEENDGVEDDEDEEVEDAPPPKKKGATKKKKKAPTKELSVSELAEKADEGDTEAGAKLEELCDEKDIDHSEYETWVETIAAELTESKEYEDDEEEDVEPPTKGDVWWFKPPRKRKRVEVEITLVSSSKETCSVKDLESDVIYKGIAWSNLALTEDE